MKNKFKKRNISTLRKMKKWKDTSAQILMSRKKEQRVRTKS